MKLSFNSSSIFTLQPDNGTKDWREKDINYTAPTFVAVIQVESHTLPPHGQLIKCFKIVKTFKVAIKVSVASD